MQRAHNPMAGGGGPPPGGYGPPPGGYGPPPGGGGPPPGGYGPPPGGAGYGPPGGFGPPGGGYGAPPAGSYGGPPGYGPPPGPRTDTLAVAGLVLSIVALLGAILNMLSGLFGTCCFLCTLGSTVIGVLVLVPAIAGIVMGGLSVSRINKTPEQFGGKGMAVAALVIGIIAALLGLAEIVLPWLGIACFAAAGSTGP